MSLTGGSIRYEQQEAMDIAVAKCFEQSEQKPAEWSEDDEKILTGIIDEIEANKSSGPEHDIPTYDKFITWLKSIRHQNHWKPSEHQMHMLRRMITAIPPGEVHNGLESLYNDLEKL